MVYLRFRPCCQALLETEQDQFELVLQFHTHISVLQQVGRQSVWVQVVLGVPVVVRVGRALFSGLLFSL